MDIKNHNLHKLSYTLMIEHVQSIFLLSAKHKMEKEKKHHRIAFKVRGHTKKAKIVIFTDGVHQ